MDRFGVFEDGLAHTEDAVKGASQDGLDLVLAVALVLQLRHNAVAVTSRENRRLRPIAGPDQLVAEVALSALSASWGSQSCNRFMQEPCSSASPCSHGTPVLGQQPTPSSAV